MKKDIVKKRTDIKEINRMRALFPSEILVCIERSAEGGFCAEIKTFPGCFTQADDFSELIEMVNDAILTYFEIPQKYVDLMPKYCPPIELAERCGAYPKIGKAETLRLFIEDSEKVKC